jgi:hypothetical protein
MRAGIRPIGVLAAAGLAACAIPPPTAPTIAAMPGRGKTLEQFSIDDQNCRSYAFASTNAGPAAQQASRNSGAGVVLGTVLGTAAGALLGAAAGNAGVGAAAGAGAGLLFGSAASGNAAGWSAAGLQRAFDIAYARCMVANGQSVPGVTTPVFVAPPGYPPYPVYVPPPGFGWGW